MSGMADDYTAMFEFSWLFIYALKTGSVYMQETHSPSPTQS